MKEKTIIPKNLEQDALEDMNQDMNLEDMNQEFLQIVDFQRNDGSFEG